MTQAKIKDWKKFMISSVVVAIISVLWNIFLVKDLPSIIIYANALEKIVGFIILGIIFLYTNPSFLRLNNQKKIIIFSVILAGVLALGELITGVSPSIGYSFVRFLNMFIGCFIGINITNFFYK